MERAGGRTTVRSLVPASASRIPSVKPGARMAMRTFPSMRPPWRKRPTPSVTPVDPTSTPRKWRGRNSGRLYVRVSDPSSPFTIVGSAYFVPSAGITRTSAPGTALPSPSTALPSTVSSGGRRISTSSRVSPSRTSTSAPMRVPQPSAPASIW